MDADLVRWSARASSDAKESCSIFLRRSRIEAGPPLQLDGAANLPGSFELLLGAVSGEVAAGFHGTASRRRLRLEQVEVTVEGELSDSLVYLGVVGAEGKPELIHLRIRVFVSSLEPEEILRDAWEDTRRRLPILGTLERVVSVDLDLKIVL